ncbi:hypothetical protein [Paraburkholderia sp. BL17N1]|uniref:hypothetical protein n=1 Tax=Paraburkholderia sp. BL17N1 TaxID=1938798 RepID=UPI000EB27BA1|nr:hypothetical protein [Paraburkholderia sp. BL17N1]RKR44578.1 hypothetical protein B0G82_2190 [Paraburkholderia sp. BL17N1]
MNFNELKAALRAEVAGQHTAGSRTLAKSLPAPLEHPTPARRVVSVRRSHVALPLVKALGDVPNQRIKEAVIDSAARRREVPNADTLLGGKRAYRVTHGGHSQGEAEARAACERGLLDGRIGADDATRIEHCLNEHRAMPVALAALLFK